MFTKLFRILYFLCVFFLAGSFVLGLSAVGQGSQSMTLNFEIESSVALELPASFDLPPVTPGQTVEASLPVIVKANVEWDLRVVGSQSATDALGQVVVFGSALETRDFLGGWEPITHFAQVICQTEPPTPSEGQEVTVELRMIGDFADPPGIYHTQLDFTLVPQL